jgi:hypothetical protein
MSVLKSFQDCTVVLNDLSKAAAIARSEVQKLLTVLEGAVTDAQQKYEDIPYDVDPVISAGASPNVVTNVKQKQGGGINFIHISVTPPVDHSEVTFANVPVEFSSHFVDGLNTMPSYLAAKRAAGLVVPGLLTATPEPSAIILG